VDSSVAALEMKKNGYDVIGVTIQTWPKEECGGVGSDKLCCSLGAIQYARSVAEDLKIPYHVIDLSKEFSDKVKKYFAEEYNRGRTPNPCVWCNSEIKFGCLVEKAKELGAAKIATGHYAKITNRNDRFYLSEAEDKMYDQSYFLYNIAKDRLPFIDFPLGAYTKQTVREIAKQNGFSSAERPSSQDICFANSDGDYRKYLGKLGVNVFTPGDILDVNGKVIGKHQGVASYTVGQRRGLRLSMKEPVYVLKIDAKNNTITVGEKERAMNKKMIVKGFNWLMEEKLTHSKAFLIRIRYNSDKVKGVVTPLADDTALVEFDEKQFAPTPGQAAVFYLEETVAGGAWIEEILE
ncbi:MAG: tRNA 2-thiouridine(34) synthase MnmA, partial [Candidatus Omnitrophica bacterium]|nr:tRNA 2-thiouridine(34) synthase MnmA [Candidatus Omnitrophota bacterium]